MTPALHQFVPTLEPGAVGGHLLQVAQVAREAGWESEVFAEHVHPSLATVGRDFRDYGRRVPARSGDVLLYHAAIGSTVADFVAARPERLVVDYHNITPVRFFADWEPEIVYGLSWGRSQLASLASRTDLGLADSPYNEGELIDLRYRRTAVAPIIHDVAALEPDADDVARLGHDGTVWLFVGRVAPNKAHHDLLKAFAVYRRVYDPRATLRIVGSPASARYDRALRDFAAALQVDDAVTFTGGVTDAELAAHYRTADVFVIVSDHEGFNVPLLEAMHHGVPIVAYAAAAVPGTLGHGGLLLPTKSPEVVAAAVDRVLSDATLRNGLVAAGRQRLTGFAKPVTRARMRELLEPLVSA